MTPKIEAHPTSSLQRYKIHLINYIIEVPTAPPSYTKSQLHLESCFRSELYEPRRSYPKKLWGPCTTKTTHAEQEVDHASLR